MAVQIDGTSGLSGVDGSASTPALQGSDTNTGISFGTDTVNVVTGGSTRTTVDSSGRLGIGTASAGLKLHVQDGALASAPTPNSNCDVVIEGTTDTGIQFLSSGQTQLRFGDAGSTGAGSLIYSHSTDSLAISTNGATRITIASDGLHTEPAIYNATGAGSTVVVNSSGEVLRTSSSLKYKTDVEDLQNEYADAILNVRPVWYRSTSKYDNPDWGWWGFIAEEVAEIDPRLVGWKTTEVINHEDGSTETVELDTPIAEDVYYDRFVPHLLNLIKRQKEAIEALETRVAQLEGGAS